MSDFSRPRIVRPASSAYRDYQRQRQLTLGDLLLENRIILLQGEIHDGNANELVMKLLYLQSENRRKDIHFYINSPGGSVSATLAIYDTMQILSCPVATYCVGLAASGGAVLLAGGAKGKRFALPHANVMIHQPYGQVGGQVSDIEIQANEILHTREVLNVILATHTGQPIERIAKDTDRDFYMTAEQAKEYGLVDDILTKQKIEVDEERSNMTLDSLCHRKERPRRAGDGHLQPPAEGPHRLSRLADRRRRGQRRRRPVALPPVGRRRRPDIHMYINSPGGSIAAGLAIYDTMQFVNCDVATYCVGQAASMAAVLLAAGAPGKRKALPNSRILIHQPLAGAEGTAEDILIHAKEFVKVKERLNRILIKHTGHPLEKIEEDTDRDRFMSAEEALEYGLIDHVIERAGQA